MKQTVRSNVYTVFKFEKGYRIVDARGEVIAECSPSSLHKTLRQLRGRFVSGNKLYLVK